jgi:hypothetical protein
LNFRFAVAELRFRPGLDHSRNAAGSNARRGTNFWRRETGPDARRAGAVREMLQCCNRQVASGPPGLVLIMVLRRHLPFGPKAFLVLLALSNESR